MSNYRVYCKVKCIVGNGIINGKPSDLLELDMLGSL